MDGPSVNWKFFTDMKKKLVADDYETILINIGSRGLHIVLNSFKTGATAAEWKVEALLSSLYYLFKDHQQGGKISQRFLAARDCPSSL